MAATGHVPHRDIGILMKNLGKSLKAFRDRFIDEKILPTNAFRKAIYRQRIAEKHYAFVAEDNRGNLLLYCPSDNTIGDTLLKQGGWAYQETDAFLDFFTQTFGSRGAHFFDLGANIGTQTLIAAASRLFRSITAVEAVPYTFSLLRANVTLNCDDPSCVHLINRALGPGEGKVTFFFNPDNPGGSSFDNDVGRDAIEVDQIPVGSLLQPSAKLLADDVLVFWVDLEGYEEALFDQLAPSLEGREYLFCVEYNRDRYQDSANSLKSFIEGHEALYLLNESGLTPIDNLDGVEKTQDIVFFRKWA